MNRFAPFSRRSRTATVLAAVAVAGAAMPLAGQSLRGSRASVERMYARAVSTDLDFFRSKTSLAEAVREGELRLIPTTLDVALEDVSYPYLLPRALDVTLALAARYRAACGERLIVTSATRPRNEQPRNASPKSVHPTGMAVDFRRPTGKCLTWLRAELLRMEQARTIEATEERRPPHFHVAVLRPAPSTTVVADRTAAAPVPSKSSTTTSSGEVAAAEPVARTYVVRPGDTLSEIAKQFGTTTKRLQTLNKISGTRIKVGQKLRVR
jgi:LysM repeat protein